MLFWIFLCSERKMQAIKFIPSAVTLLNLSLGFIAIAMSDLYISSILIFTCIGLDALDGILARALNAQSAIGKELDSLADLVSFGVAPSYIYFLVAPIDHWVILLAPLMILWGSALRLAKFNMAPESKNFKGMPTPATAFFLAGLFLAVHYGDNFLANWLEHASMYLFVGFFLMFIMNSRLEMFSLKEVNLGPRKNKYQLATLSIYIALLFIDPKSATPLSVLFYISLSALKHVRH